MGREGGRLDWIGRWPEQLAQDVRVGLRMLRRNPGFTATAVLTLALGTGATTAIFSIVNSVLLQPLPLAEPDRLVKVNEIHLTGGAGSVLGRDLDEFRRESRTFDGFSGHDLTTRHLEGAKGTERLTTVITDRQFFPLLGVQPIVGRTYGPGDPPTVVVLAAHAWTRLFDRDPGVVGKTLTFAGTVWDPVQRRSVRQVGDVTVIGVMPERFQFPHRATSGFAGSLPESAIDIWMPEERRGGRYAKVVGRLKPGVSIDAAHAELTALEQRMDVITPNPYRPTGVELTPLADDVLESVGPSLWLLFGAVGLVLAAACATVANLLLARLTLRAREVVTRAALGAGRLRLVRQFLAESLLLSLAGGLAGVVVARWGTSLLVAIAANRIPRAHEVALDWRAFAFLLLVCVATAVLFGLAPALTAARTDVQTVTKESSGQATLGAGYGRLRDALVIAEVALAFVLACGALLVMREVERLRRVDTGMITDRVLTLHMTPKAIDSADYYRIEERVAQIPGVEAAGFIQLVPLQNWDWIGTLEIRGRPRVEFARLPKVELRTVTPGYFRALGISIRRGRNLTEGDRDSRPEHILINEALARAHFRGEDPIGRETDRGTIVGVVGDVRQAVLDKPAVPEIYSGLTASAGIASDLGMSLMVRTSRPPHAILSAVRSAVREVNPTLAIFNVRTMTQVVMDSLWELNLYRWLIGMFAGLALVLSAVGLYGVIAYSVSSRTRELAVRLALGSEPAALARLVLRRGMVLAAAGIAVGCVGVLALLATLRDLPAAFAVSPASLAIVAVLLVAIALIAALVPALRVARLDPAQALRYD